MFTDQVINSNSTKKKIAQQKANSKFGGIYSKAKPSKWGASEKPSKLAEIESKLAVDHFSQLLMLQNRDYGEADLGDLLNKG